MLGRVLFLHSPPVLWNLVNACLDKVAFLLREVLGDDINCYLAQKIVDFRVLLRQG